MVTSPKFWFSVTPDSLYLLFSVPAVAKAFHCCYGFLTIDYWFPTLDYSFLILLIEAFVFLVGTELLHWWNEQTKKPTSTVISKICNLIYNVSKNQSVNNHFITVGQLTSQICSHPTSKYIACLKNKKKKKKLSAWWQLSVVFRTIKLLLHANMIFNSFNDYFEKNNWNSCWDHQSSGQVLIWLQRFEM
jgi:hypothetical protein